MEPAHSELTDAEHCWVAEHLAALVARGVDVASATALGEEHRTAWSRWEREGGDPNEAVLRTGVGVGQHLVDRCGLRWVVVTDEHGNDLAVHGQPGDVLVFPTNLVAKRWNPDGHAALAEVLDALAASVARVRGR